MSYRGNKSPTTLYPKIINCIPKHKVYIELFAGSAQILRKKKPAERQIVVEKDDSLIYPDGVEVHYGSVFDYMLNNLEEGHLLCREDTFIYMDPPYIIDERRCQKHIYKHEMTTTDHRLLLIFAKYMKKCKIAISHYPCKLYDDMLLKDECFGHLWHKIEMKVCYNGKKATEALYMNFDPKKIELHETTYVGRNKTDRQRIKRKVTRWLEKINKLPEYEKQALIEAINNR